MPSFLTRLEQNTDAVQGRHHRLSRQSRTAGFTLIEILVVLAIIGLIVSLVGPRVLGFLADSKVKTSRIQVEVLTSAVDLFYLDNGRYPNAAEGLSALVTKPSDDAGWNGPYLKGGKVPNDPWGRAYIYHVPGKQAPYEIVSQGPNGTSQEANEAVNSDMSGR